MAKTRSKRNKQNFLPGVEPLSIPELDSAMELYHDLKCQRMQLLEQEVEAKEEVKRLMKENKLKKYVDVTSSPELEATVESETEEKVSVKAKKPRDLNGEAE